MEHLYWYEVTLLIGAKQSKGSIDVLSPSMEEAKTSALAHYSPLRSQIQRVKYMGSYSDYMAMMIECQRINAFIEQLELL